MLFRNKHESEARRGGGGCRGGGGWEEQLEQVADKKDCKSEESIDMSLRWESGALCGARQVPVPSPVGYSGCWRGLYRIWP